MGAREGNPARKSARAVAAASENDASSSARSSSEESSQESAKSGTEAGESGDEPETPGKPKRRHRGHGAKAASNAPPAVAAANDPTTPGGQAPNIATPDSAPPEEADEERPDPPSPPGQAQHELAQVTPLIGTPQLPAGAPLGNEYAATEGGAATVQPTVVQTPTAKAISYPAGLPPDANGSGPWARIEGVDKKPTPLQYPSGKSLNPGKIPYIAVPQDLSGVKVGDYAAVTYGGKTVFAIVGDYCPPGVIGGGSMVLASGLGINPDPKAGGVPSGVKYTILAGSAGAAIPTSADEVQSNGKSTFDKAGISVR